MKRCPKCTKTYADNTLNFCLEDGAWLIDGSGREDHPTEVSGGDLRFGESPTEIFDSTSAFPNKIFRFGYEALFQCRKSDRRKTVSKLASD